MKLIVSSVIWIAFFTSTAFAAHLSRNASHLLKPSLRSGLDVGETCVDLASGGQTASCKSCVVSRIEELGTLGDTNLAVARYEFRRNKRTNEKPCAYGTVIFKHQIDQTDFTALWGVRSKYSPTELVRPSLLVGRALPLIQVPLVPHGHPSKSGEALLAWQDGQMKELDSRSFQSEIKSRLPAGLEVSRRLSPNLEEMTVESNLWKKSDPNCCPTGGKIRATLDIQREKIILKSFARDNSVN